MNFSWFPFSIAATVLLGAALVFYKVPAARDVNRHATTFWSLFVPFCLSLVFFFPYIGHTTGYMVLVAALWGATFAAIVSLQMYALRNVETNVLFPVTTTASLVIALGWGIIVFGEKISSVQLLGIVLVVFVVFAFLYPSKGVTRSSLIPLNLVLSITLISAFNRILQKYVADNFDIHAYQIYQYAFAALFGFGLLYVFNRADWQRQFFGGAAARIGSLIGALGFLGGYALLLALSKGPFSLITSIHSLYIFVVALLGHLLFKESLTPKKVALLVLAVTSTVLIRLG